MSIQVWRPFLTVACFMMVLGGCAGDGENGDGGTESAGDADTNDDADDGGAGPCAEQEIRVWGTLNGMSIDRTGVATGHATVLDRTTVTGDGLNVLLESEGGWTFGGTENTRVVIYGLDMAGLADIGNCLDDGFPGVRTVDDDGEGAVFSIGMLYEGPSSDVTDPFPGYCGTPTIEGDLEGCFRWP